jgi:hypothetical protein
MRSSVSVRAPQAIGSRVHTKLRHHAGLRLIQGGQSIEYEFQQALRLYVYFLNLLKKRGGAEKAEAETETSPTEETAPEIYPDLETENLTKASDWARWERIRTNRRWVQRASMSPQSVEAFNQQVATLQAADNDLFSEKAARAYERMRVSDKALGGFVRHYFGHGKNIKKFCEWMSESPIFRARILRARYGVSRFNDLPSIADKRAVRAEMRNVLTSMLRALAAIRVSAAHRDKTKNEHGEVIIVNESTRERFCAVVDLDMDIVLAFYPASEMNGRRHKAPRQLDHRLQRYH